MSASDEDFTTVSVEIEALSLYTHHGVTAAEREIGQRLELDIAFEVSACDAILTDRVEDTVDYGEVVDLVSLSATERSYKTLERLCHVIAERIVERWDTVEVRVKATKPEPPLPVAIGSVSVEVVREGPIDDAIDGSDLEDE